MVQSRKPDPIQELRERLQITKSILDNAESFTFSPYFFALQHMAIEGDCEIHLMVGCKGEAEPLDSHDVF